MIRIEELPTGAWTVNAGGHVRRFDNRFAAMTHVTLTHKRYDFEVRYCRERKS